MRIAKEVGSWLISLGVAIVIALLISIFVLQPYKVLGHSMDPTLHDKERVYVSKLSYTFSYLPSYGNIVIIDSRISRDRSFKDDFLESPLVSMFKNDTENNRSYYIKRVIGKPGDLIELKDGKVYRNGEVLNEPYLKEAMEHTEDRSWKVPDNHIFVMGDNRNNSRDSRDIGFVPLDHVLGQKLGFNK